MCAPPHEQQKCPAESSHGKGTRRREAVALHGVSLLLNTGTHDSGGVGDSRQGSPTESHRYQAKTNTYARGVWSQVCGSAQTKLPKRHFAPPPAAAPRPSVPLTPPLTGDRPSISWGCRSALKLGREEAVHSHFWRYRPYSITCSRRWLGSEACSAGQRQRHVRFSRSACSSWATALRKRMVCGWAGG